MVEKDFEQVGKFLIRAAEICGVIQGAAGSHRLEDFMAAMSQSPDIEPLRKEVEAFSTQFPMTGVGGAGLAADGQVKTQIKEILHSYRSHHSTT